MDFTGLFTGKQGDTQAHTLLSTRRFTAITRFICLILGGMKTSESTYLQNLSTGDWMVTSRSLD